jgi:CubicO group peptidase (beta-lactamase class C family)
VPDRIRRTLRILEGMTHGAGGAPTRSDLDADRLAAATDYADEKLAGLTSLLVACQGRIIVERYYRGGAFDRPTPVFSVTKSFVSALVGIALRDGRLSGLDDPVVSALGIELPMNHDSRVSNVTLRHLLTMTAGFKTGTDAFESLAAMEGAPWVERILRRPMASSPGSRFAYDNGAAHLVSAVITRHTGMSAAAFARAELFQPLGIEEDPRWPSDPQGISYGGLGLELTSRDLAKLGDLYLRGGRWDGRELIPREYVHDSTRSHVSIGVAGDGYGYFWWTKKASNGLPEFFAAGGQGGQFVAVVRTLDLIVVTTSNARTRPGSEYGELLRRIAAAIPMSERSSRRRRFFSWRAS